MLRLPRRDDRGGALVLVIGIMVTLSIVGLTLVSTTLHASATSSAARAGLQAQAAAEQAIDDALAQLSLAAVRGQERTYPCEMPLSVSGGAGVVEVVTEINYETQGLPDHYWCSLMDGDEITGMKLTAHATTEVQTANGARVIERVVEQIVDVVPQSTGDPLFAHGLFSDATLTTTNNFRVLGGGAHTNGSYKCSSNGQINGPLTVIGSVEMTNRCRVDGDLLAGGSVKGPGLLAPGPGIYNFGGSVTAANGDIIVQGDARGAGDAVAAHDIRRNDGGDIRVVFPGLIWHDYPTTPPAVVEMPEVYWTHLTPDGTNVKDFKLWLQEMAVWNNAPTSSQAYQGTTCTASNAQHSVNGYLWIPEATVLDARTCDVVFQGVSSSDPLVLELEDDLTIVARSFTSTNGLRVISTKPHGAAKLRIIVPLPEGAASCSGSGTGGITLQAGGVHFAEDVEVLFYTNGLVRMTNGVDMTGAVYGCQTNFSADTTIRHSDMTPPGMMLPPGDRYEFRQSARYDLSP